MNFCIPSLDTGLRAILVKGHVQRRPVDILFRGKQYVAAKNEPSMQRKAGFAGFTEEIADLEIMLALSTGTPEPVANSTDQVRVYAPIRAGVTRTYKDYRIVSVQTDLAPDCYQLTLSLRHL